MSASELSADSRGMADSIWTHVETAISNILSQKPANIPLACWELHFAVEKAFKVKVTTVNVISIHGEKKRVGRKMTVTPSWKKAIVTLKTGDKIQLFEGV